EHVTAGAERDAQRHRHRRTAPVSPSVRSGWSVSNHHVYVLHYAGHQKEVRTVTRKIRGIGWESKSLLPPTLTLPRQFVCGSTPGNLVHMYRLRPENRREVRFRFALLAHASGIWNESATSRSDM